MSDVRDPVEGYFALMARRPELFRNAPAGGVDILTSADDIAGAQAEAKALRTARGMKSNDTRIGILAEDPYMLILRDAVRFPNGTRGLYNRIVETNPVAILPVMKGHPVLIRVYRHGLRDWSWEFPRGGCDGGVTPEQGALREVAEEVGGAALSILPLGTFTPGGSSLSIRAHLFFAEVESLGEPDVLEGITDVVAMPVARLEEMVRNDVIIDGFSLALFARARLRGLI
jgi:ADP-ribose pyrophosphatase